MNTNDTIERELSNETTDDRIEAAEVIREDLEKIAKETDTEYALVRIEPLSKDQHEANEALRQLVAQRSDDSDT